MMRISRMFCIILVSMVVMPAITARAQDEKAVRVTGQVTDATDHDVIPGVKVYIKGTQTGIVTDLNGKYALSVPKGSTLVLLSHHCFWIRVPPTSQISFDILFVVVTAFTLCFFKFFWVCFAPHCCSFYEAFFVFLIVLFL